MPKELDTMAKRHVWPKQKRQTKISVTSKILHKNKQVIWFSCSSPLNISFIHTRNNIMQMTLPRQQALA